MSKKIFIGLAFFMLLGGFALANGVEAVYQADGNVYCIDRAGTRFASYNVARGSWSRVYPVATEFFGGIPRGTIRGINAIMDYQGVVYIISHDGNSFMSYNPRSKRWSRTYPVRTEFFGGGLPLDGIEAVYQYEGKVYVIDKRGTSFCSYDPQRKRWSRAYPISEFHGGPPIRSIGAAFVFEGKTYVIDDSETRFASYDPRTRRWSRVYPVATEFFGGVPF